MEAAQVLGLGKTTVYGLIDSGKLPFCRIGTHRRIRSVDLDALLADQTNAA
jgi:excisionase family DNA binding protein